jgi:hypothetical protein
MANEESKFESERYMDRYEYHFDDERMAARLRAYPYIVDNPAEPQPEDKPAQP